jgi:hypothetical protein
MIDQATEFYNWDYSDLIKVIGVGLAKRKVALYQSPHLSSNPFIQECLLLKTYQESGNKVEDLMWLDSSPDFSPDPPQIDPEDFPDPTDKGLTRLSHFESKRRSNQSPKSARRANKNV